MAQFFPPVPLTATDNPVLLRAAQLPASSGTRLVFLGASWVGSVVLKVDMGAPGQAQSLTSIPYLTADTGATNAADVAITASGGFIVQGLYDNYDLYAVYTHTSGSAVVYVLSEDAAIAGTSPGGGVFASEVDGSGGNNTFGSAIPYTGAYTFPSSLAVTTSATVGTTAAITGKLTVTGTVTAAAASADGTALTVTPTAAANSDVLSVLKLTMAAGTPGAYTGLVRRGLSIAAFTVVGDTSPGTPSGISVGIITGTGASVANALLLAPPTGATTNYLISHTTAATFNVLANGTITASAAQMASVGTTPGTAGNDFGFTAAQGGNTTIVTTGVGGKGGGYGVTTGAGGTAALAATAGTGGAGGDYALTTGAGAASAVTGAGTGTGGKGGAIAFLTGVGGAVTTSTGANVGGASGAVTFTTAAGGAASNGSANTGGASGVLTFATGNGGAGATAQGNSGAIVFQTGTTTATVGTISFKPAGTTAATIGVTALTMASTYKVQCAVSTTANASFNLGDAGTAPTSPANGDMWVESNTVKVRLNGATVTVTTS